MIGSGKPLLGLRVDAWKDCFPAYSFNVGHEDTLVPFHSVLCNYGTGRCTVIIKLIDKSHRQNGNAQKVGSWHTRSGFFEV